MWHFAVVRVQAVSGREAAAYSFLGEVPTDLIITELVAPLLIGHGDEDLRSVGDRCVLAAGPPLRDVVRPAASLVETCLWDLASQERGLPLWSLLVSEPTRNTAPVMVVEHRRDEDTVHSFAARIAAHTSEGFEIVKIKHYGKAVETRERLAAIRDLVGDEVDLVVDAGWSWPDSEVAVAEASSWDDFRLAWIEDPFSPERVRDAAQLRRAIASPIAVGDMVTSVDLAERLIIEEAVDGLRVDVTMMGGFAGVERLAHLAATRDVWLSPELSIETHQHLAFACPGVREVETYAPDSVWRGDVFVQPGALKYDGPGRLLPPTNPGSGLTIDWAAVHEHAKRYSRYP
jgi:L-alanine-DL-glutamate epimerase-like enolase superfamily enzyme